MLSFPDDAVRGYVLDRSPPMSTGRGLLKRRSDEYATLKEAAVEVNRLGMLCTEHGRPSGGRPPHRFAADSGINTSSVHIVKITRIAILFSRPGCISCDFAGIT
jgi:hypothetical protein